ncbi:MAG: hypothetical protein V4733_00350 [Verrucomicrobiota bacterium]
MFDDDKQKAPFLIPFVVAMAFGIPVSVVWFLIAMKVGFVATIITILLGCVCGFGARISARGRHPAEAAIMATLILILLSISVITISVLALEIAQSFLATAVAIVRPGGFTDFSNACVIVAGKTFIGYPLGLYAAYRVSDGS